MQPSPLPRHAPLGSAVAQLGGIRAVLRNEGQHELAGTIDALAIHYVRARAVGRLSRDGYAQLYIGDREQPGSLAAQVGRGRKTLAAYLVRLAAMQTPDGAPLLQLRTERVVRGGGPECRRFARLPLLANGAPPDVVLRALAAIDAPVEPPTDVPVEGCDCDAARVLRREEWETRATVRSESTLCMGCGLVTLHPLRFLKRTSGPHRTLPVLQLGGGPALPVSPLDSFESSVPNVPAPACACEGAPPLPPGYDHWCAGCHPGRHTPLPPGDFPCSRCKPPSGRLV